jgi:curli production assembly/transport component CsgF
MKFPTLLSALFVLILCLSGSIGQAQDLVYTPVNPAFGGNTINYSWLLNSANAQNSIQDPARTANDLRDDPLANFTSNLERQLLNQLSREIFNRQFGEDFFSEDGVTTIGNFQVEVTTGVDGLLINITDFSSGGTTQLTVPFF